MSLSFGLACGSLIAAWYLGNAPQTEQVAVTNAPHRTLLTVGGLTMLYRSRSGHCARAMETMSVEESSRTLRDVAIV